MPVDKLCFWLDFVEGNRVDTDSVPLFATDAGRVRTFPYGSNRRPMLQRSSEMEALMRGLGRTLESDYESDCIAHEGILYVMFRREGSTVVPLYIGKAEIYGKSGNLSINVRDLVGGDSKFGRWGYGYAYHMGDLSAATLPGHAESKKTLKYEAWRDALFTLDSHGPTVRGDIRFWACLWNPQRKSIWQEYGRTRLTFEEYLLIGVTSDLFPANVLNREGRNR